MKGPVNNKIFPRSASPLQALATALFITLQSSRHKKTMALMSLQYFWLVGSLDSISDRRSVSPLISASKPFEMWNDRLVLTYCVQQHQNFYWGQSSFRRGYNYSHCNEIELCWIGATIVGQNCQAIIVVEKVQQAVNNQWGRGDNCDLVGAVTEGKRWRAKVVIAIQHNNRNIKQQLARQSSCNGESDNRYFSPAIAIWRQRHSSRGKVEHKDWDLADEVVESSQGLGIAIGDCDPRLQSGGGDGSSAAGGWPGWRPQRRQRSRINLWLEMVPPRIFMCNKSHIAKTRDRWLSSCAYSLYSGSNIASHQLYNHVPIAKVEKFVLHEGDQELEAENVAADELHKVVGQHGVDLGKRKAHEKLRVLLGLLLDGFGHSKAPFVMFWNKFGMKLICVSDASMCSGAK
ncbi:hypothetical protein DFJ73DRAFT_911334 [Zopfochytrium polystomum]|nr:hypothetical protein DFJ73DRAFT_911334 [Zopfochytrium polystomum]